MKTKIILFVAGVALVTLSFTFANVQKPLHKEIVNSTTVSHLEPVGGLFADEVVKWAICPFRRLIKLRINRVPCFSFRVLAVFRNDSNLRRVKMKRQSRDKNLNNYFEPKLNYFSLKGKGLIFPVHWRNEKNNMAPQMIKF